MNPPPPRLPAAGSNRERQGYGNRRIDGVAAPLHHIHPDLGGELVGGSNDAVLRPDWLADCTYGISRVGDNREGRREKT